MKTADILKAHRKTRIEGCDCGWEDLGRDHLDHVAEMVDVAWSLYEKRCQMCLPIPEWDMTPFVCSGCGETTQGRMV